LSGFKLEIVGIPVRIAKIDHFHMDAELQFETQTLRLSPVGLINESFPLQELNSYLNKVEGSIKRVVLTLDRVERMNSEGTKLWIKLLARIQSRMRCQLSKVTEVFLELAIVLPDVLGVKGTEVTDVLAPYHCTHCGERQTLPWKLQDLTKKASGDEFALPEGKCGQCGNPPQFDAFESDYFELFKRLKQAPVT
jgi:hypothetical protein